MKPGWETDLHWFAFLYVSGELSPADEAAFEGRLTNDQAAREAVFSAAELALALDYAVPADPPVVSPERRSRPSRMLPWAIAAAAACVALAVGLSFLGRRNPDPPRLMARPSLPQHQRLPVSQVALAWSSLSQEEGTDPIARPSGLVDSQAGAETEVVPFLEEGVSKPPGWLLIATSLRPTTGPKPDGSKEQ